MKRAAVITALLVTACGAAPKADSMPKRLPLPAVVEVAEEKHLRDVQQLTLAGENAEAYWAWSGRELILQSRAGDADCDRIYRMPLDTGCCAGSDGAAPPGGASMPSSGMR